MAYIDRMASHGASELIIVGGREVTISNPRRCCSRPGHTKLDLVHYYLAVADGALRGAGRTARTCSCAIRTASAASSSIQKRAPESRPAVDRGRGAAAFRRAARAEEVVPRDAAALVWMANLACLELHPHPVRADDLDHPGRAARRSRSGARRRVAADARGRAGRARARSTTSASSAGRRRPARAACTSTCASSRAGRSTRCAARRWRSRARSSGARRRSRRASGGRKNVTACSSTTTRTRRTARSPRAYSVRPTPDARVSAPLTWDEIDDVRPGRLHARARCRRASPRSATGTRRSTTAVLARRAARALGAAGARRARAMRRGRRTIKQAGAASRARASQPSSAGGAATRDSIR